MASKNSIFSDNWVDIVFEDRNQAYGAYEIRKKNGKITGLALLLAILFFTFVVSLPVIIRVISGIIPEKQDLKMTEVTTLEEPPPLDKEEPPPPPAEPPPPLKSTVQFTPPVIVEEVPEEETPPTQEEMKEVDAGTTTQEGDETGVDLSLLETGKGNEVVEEPAPVETFKIVEQPPVFPGGDAELMKYIMKSIKYPPIAKENGITGTVYVEFVVDQNGEVVDVRVARGAQSKDLDTEAVRVIKSLPKWTPGRQTGKAVRVQFTLPIRFVLN
ncbi:MAG: energy transducer TonB [Bacteroidia bacterium]|nr:energy transducer TonB [Bacteroidia bacterium]